MREPIDYRKFWTDWLAAKENGMTQVEHAAALGLSYTTYNNRITVARTQAQTFLPPSRYPVWNDPLKIQGDALILGDLHIPYHHAEHVNRCIKFAIKNDIRQCILGGDALDMHALSHWPDDVEAEKHSLISQQAEDELLKMAETLPKKAAQELREKLADMTRAPSDLTDEINESKRIINLLAKNFETTWWFMGNHESRLIRKLEKAMPAAQMAALFGATDPRFKMSSYYYAELDSAGVKYRVTHPKQAGKGSSKRLVPIHGINIIQLHNHHFSVQSDPSGKYLAIEPGMCADPARLDYTAQRDSATDAHVVGAVAVMQGKPVLLNDWF